MRKNKTVIISIVLILCLFTLFSCTTTAKWQDQYSDTDSGKNVSVDPVNPSAKYIVFAALNSAGNLITRPAEGEPEATTAYAVVGYTGLVAELVVPSTYNSLPVTKVLVASPYSDYYCYRDGAAYTGNDARLANQTVVTSIVFGSNVARIGEGVCNSMINLASVTFSRSVTLEDYAFLNCGALASVGGTYAWGSATASSTAFFGCTFNPAGA